jgi:pimeloyl-ACP methyl ester carboxylesterase
MNEVRSKDGTTIAYDQAGDGGGPVVILIGGGPNDRSANTPLAALLAPRLTVINYDRRGRGDSGDTPPFTVDREYDDLAALIDQAGADSASLFGTSVGGVLALAAAADRGLPIEKLAVWEPPYIVDGDGSRPPVVADYRQQLVALLAADRRGDMVELFMTQAVGMPAELVAGMRQAPFWSSMEQVAHALVYDAALIGDFSVPTERLAAVTAPTLVIDGGTTPWLSRTADAVAEAIPQARRHTLQGQPHNVDPAALAPALTDFFNG